MTGDSAAAPRAAGHSPEVVCRACGLEVVFRNGDVQWGQPLHAATMSELGADRHRAVPIYAALARRPRALGWP